MDLDLQLELFEAALDELDLDSNLARVPRSNQLIHQLSRYLRQQIRHAFICCSDTLMEYQSLRVRGSWLFPRFGRLSNT